MSVAAQTEWPKGQPIRVLIPFAPGGVPDIISRIVTPKMSEGLGQGFVIDNKPGAGGGLAGQLLAQAPSDGYTLMTGTVSTLSIVPAINPSLKYDPNAFAAIGLAAVVPMVALVRAESPAQDTQVWSSSSRRARSSTTARRATARSSNSPPSCSSSRPA